MTSDDLPPLQPTLEEDLAAIVCKVAVAAAEEALKVSPRITPRELPEVKHGRRIYRYGK